jgi:multidrug efflux pump subunit AcrA (membrane-fusion protein)
MKTIFRSAFAALAVLMAASCGKNASKGVQQAEVAMADEAPTVSVEQVSVREVPQLSTYTSTVQAYVKNNIAPQMAGRISKINVEIGDFVTKGQVLAEMDKTSLLQAQLQLQNQEVELQRLKALYETGGISKSDFDAVELAYNVAKTQVENLEENTVLRSPVNGVVTA